MLVGFACRNYENMLKPSETISRRASFGLTRPSRPILFTLKDAPPGLRRPQAHERLLGSGARQHTGQPHRRACQHRMGRRPEAGAGRAQPQQLREASGQRLLLPHGQAAQRLQRLEQQGHLAKNPIRSHDLASSARMALTCAYLRPFTAPRVVMALPDPHWLRLVHSTYRCGRSSCQRPLSPESSGRPSPLFRSISRAPLPLSRRTSARRLFRTLPPACEGSATRLRALGARKCRALRPCRRGDAFSTPREKPNPHGAWLESMSHLAGKAQRSLSSTPTLGAVRPIGLASRFGENWRELTPSGPTRGPQQCHPKANEDVA